MRQSRGLLALGSPSSSVAETEAEAAVEEVEGSDVVRGAVVVSSGTLGSGQVMSLHSSGQNSLIVKIPLPCGVKP